MYNLGPDVAEVGGWQLDDGANAGGSPHTIPLGTTIPVGGWWTWRIGSAYLNNAGDDVRLLDSTGAIRDSTSYTNAVAGMSSSRLPDGTGAWVDGTPPTPDAANRGADALPQGIFLNEILPHPPTGQPEWIELYSTYTATVDLSGWRLDDVDGGSAPTVIKAGTMLAPGQWLQLILPNNILNDGGDQARLLAPDGTVVDLMNYGKTRNPTSWSRLPDGFGPWYSNTPPTPNAPNAPPPEAPAAPPASEIVPGSAAVVGSLLITEVVYDAPSDREESDNEWIEITNPTSTTIQLIGWRVQDNRAANELPSFEIAPAEVVVLATTADLLRFFPTFSGTLVLVGGSKLGNGLGNNGDQLALIDGVGSVIDALSWGNNTAVFDPAAPDAKTGHSLQRQPATSDTDSAADWVDSAIPSPGDLATGGVPVVAPDAPALPDVVDAGPPTTANVGAILVVQVLYDPRSPIAEPGGEWLELLNTTATTITLRGWTVSDARDADTLPTLTLAPDEIALVGASASISTTYDLSGQVVALRGSIGAGLNNGGDALMLRDGAGTTIDALSWGDNTTVFDPAAPDGAEGASLLREPPDGDTDSAADWLAQADAIPHGAVVIERPEWILPADSSVILSEVLAAPKAVDWDSDGSANRYDEWIELVNLGEEAVDLGDWTLDDLADGGSKPYVIPAGTVIAADGYLVLPSALTGLNLNNTGLENVRLLRPDGSLADVLEYRNTKPDRSWSRVPSPDGAWVAATAPTPNAPNSDASAGAGGRAIGQTVPIATLRGLPFTMTVAISGVVTVKLNGLRKHALYLQDDSGGVMVLFKSTLEWPLLEPGQRLTVRGKTSTYHGETQIKITTLDDMVLGTLGRATIPVAVRGSAINAATVGQLVQVRGTYLKADGRDIMIIANDGTTVRVHPPTGMKKPRYRKGAPITAVGIVGRYNETIRLQLRGLADLGIIGDLPDTGGEQRFPLGWLIGGLLAAGMLLRWRAARF